MSDMTIKDALDYLDNVCVCHGCECLQDHDWGGCYRTTTTGKMACDLRDEAVDVLRKVVFRAMGAVVHYYIESGYKCDIFQELKDLPSAEPERTAKVENVQVEWGDDEYVNDRMGDMYHYGNCGNCGKTVSHNQKYCHECGARLEWK